jgi:iron complex outermembrane receptor protein
MKKLSLLWATTALVMPVTAFAQSTGSQDFEEEEIVITGTRNQEVGGVQAPDTTKAKAALTAEVISRQNPGQTILDTINLVPGVSFQNNDAYGSSGGTLNIRGFSSDRVSLTVDGIPLNDTGNYAVYSNQQFDPEVIGEVSVNLGTTDVDSPTASAAGGTVNYRTITPREELGAMVSASYGQFDFHRVFGMIETGTFTPWGTRAFVSASKATNDNPFNNYSKVNKQQYNAKIYQPLGTRGDFISVAAHYNQNRNNFFGSLPLRWDTTRVVNGVTVPRIVGGQANNRFPMNNDERKYLLNFPCLMDVAQPGVADAPAPSSDPRNGLIFSPDPQGNFASCGTEFERRYNPSNTGNIRVASRFTLGAFTVTIEPSYQYTKANGGGVTSTTSPANEGLRDINPAGGTATVAQCRTTPTSATNTCVAGFLGGIPYFGRDINGDGDALDTVILLTPSQTQTHRYGVIAGVRWDINDDHAVRAGYTFDRGRHRQTGEVGLLDAGGEPLNVFPVDNPLADVTGENLQKRDRLSYAILHQLWSEYRGEFLDGNLVVNAGLRLPFFKRELNNFCATSSASGFVECFGRDNPRAATFQTLNPTIQGPQRRVFKYDAILPNVGFTYDFMPRTSVFANYAKGLSVPSTDNLYNSFFFAPDTAAASPRPEKTDNVDVGVRYRSTQIQAQLGAFYNRYKDRTASAFDPELNVSVFRNLGRVDKYGIDGYVSYQPIKELNVYLFGSYLKSEIKDDLIIGECSAAQVTAKYPGCTAVGQNILAPTAGKREAGAPKYTLGGTVRGTVGPVEIGVTAKRTGPRFLFDTNEPLFAGNVLTPAGITQIFPASTPAYWLVNLDARFSMADMGLERTYVQFNVYNLFNQFYVGGSPSGLNQSITQSGGSLGAYGAPPFVQIGAPRTVSATLTVGF